MIRDTNIGVWIEYKHYANRTRIYVMGERCFYTIVDGRVTENQIPDNGCQPIGDDSFFLECPIWFADTFAQGVAKWLETKGGINAEQQDKGKIERFKDETEWLRKLIEKQIK